VMDFMGVTSSVLVRAAIEAVRPLPRTHPDPSGCDRTRGGRLAGTQIDRSGGGAPKLPRIR
jgi:hypothetical protein